MTVSPCVQQCQSWPLGLLTVRQAALRGRSYKTSDYSHVSVILYLNANEVERIHFCGLKASCHLFRATSRAPITDSLWLRNWLQRRNKVFKATKDFPAPR